MWEGSKAQTGCFAALLMFASGGFTLKAVFRRILLDTDPQRASAIRHASPWFWVLAALLTIIAVFAAGLKRWALIAYYVVALTGIAWVVGGHGGWGVAVPLIIGLVAITGVLYLRREYL